MDIQAERRNTAMANKRADKAEKRADKAEKSAVEAKKKAAEAEQKAAEALSRAAIAEENEIKSIIEVCQELGASKDSAVRRLMGKKI